jgi:hypothetical protein
MLLQLFCDFYATKHLYLEFYILYIQLFIFNVRYYALGRRSRAREALPGNEGPDLQISEIISVLNSLPNHNCKLTRWNLLSIRWIFPTGCTSRPVARRNTPPE